MKKISLLLLLLICIKNSVFALSTLGNASGTTAAGTICAPSASVQIITQFTIVQTAGFTTLTSLKFTTAGTYAATDITDFKLYANNSASFATAFQIGATIAAGLGTGLHTFTPGTPLFGTTYYWIVIDVPGTATACNTISVNAIASTDIAVAAGGAAGSAAAGGTQTLNKVPVVTATAAPNPLCSGDNLTLTGTGVACNVYSWAGPSAYSSALLNPAAFAVTAANAGVYSLTGTNACGSSTATTAAVVVNPLPTGVTATAAPNPVCSGSNLTLTGTATGATTYLWTGPAGSGYSSAVLNPAAFVSSAVDAGVFTLTATTAAGCSASASTAAVAVNSQPTGVTASAAPNPLCENSNLTLTGTGVGGSSPIFTWTGPGIVPITGLTPAAFAVTVANAGIYTLTASISGCADVVATTPSVVVNPAPTAVTATAAPNPLCAGDMLSLTGTATGATTYSWTGPAGSGYSSALLNPAAFAVTVLDAGVYTLTATTAAGCSATASTASVNISAGAGSITGTLGVCTGGTSVLSDAAAGGSWTSANPLVASVVAATGLVTGVSVGTTTISYSVGACTATAIVTVSTPPNAGIISGHTNICTGVTDTLLDASAGGTWSASNGHVTISATGVVTPVSVGIDTITYLVSNACGIALTNFTDTVSLGPNVGFISGPVSVCAGTFTLLTDTATGGVWSCSNALGTITGTGLFSAITAGIDTVYYTSSTACGSASATKVITINPLPIAGTIGGPSIVCVGSTINLTETAAGGVWSSINGNATVSGAGVVTGVNGGIDTIKYTVTNGCGSLSAAWPISINPIGAGTITGPNNVCVGSSVTLTDSVPGGSFSSGNANATITGAGTMSGVNPGIDTITYTIVSVCGAYATTTVITVNALPNAGVITGPGSVCQGANITLTDSITGGSWASADTAIATVGAASGIVTGVSGSTVNINYFLTSAFGCVSEITTLVTVNPAPVVNIITGTTNQCIDATTTLSDLTPSGIWTVSDTTKAIISSTTGAIMGISQGIVNVSYSITDALGCIGSAITPDTINTVPSSTPITGTMNVCVNGTTALSNTTIWGTWSSANTATAVINPVTGMVTGIAAGSTLIKYDVTNNCGSVVDSAILTVNPLPTVAAITGLSGNICSGASVNLFDVTTGGTWSSNDNAIATVTDSGLVAGVSMGTATINYSVTNSFGCVGTATVNVTIGGSLPASVIPSGYASLCHATHVYMHVTSSLSGLTYQWLDNGVLISGATNSFYNASTAGNYKVTVGNGTCEETLNGPVVTAPVAPIIAFNAPNILYTGSYLTYQWFYNGILIPGANSSIFVFSRNGAYNVVVADAYGCTDTSSLYYVTSVISSVNEISLSDEISFYPNPASSKIFVKAPETVNVQVVSVDGKTVLELNDAKEINVEELPSGLFILKVYSQEGVLLKTGKFTKIK